MFDLNFAKDSFPLILKAAPLTIVISLAATLIGLILAILIAVARERKIPVLSQVLGVLVSFIRGTPILVQLYVVYYGLPELLVLMQSWGWNTDPNGLPAIVIALSAYGLNAMANLSESIRAAYRSVDHGQYEAALTVGMTPWQSMTQVVVPQLIANLIPNFTNILLDLIKDTALVYNIGIVEIMGQANIISSEGFKYLETYTDALIVYIIICWIFGLILQVVERKVRRRYVMA